MKRYTVKELEAILAAHGVRRCEACGEYEERSSGVGGVQSGDIGRDSQGRLVHIRCIGKLPKPKKAARVCTFCDGPYGCQCHTR